MSLEKPISIEKRFSESKVRDEEGNLLKVYHFSNEDIQEFSLEHRGKNWIGDDGFFGGGIYFTDSDDSYNYGAKRYAAYLNLRNPLIVRNPTTDDVQALRGKRQELLDQGYDGVMVWNDASEDRVIDTPHMKGIEKGYKGGWSEICVLKPEDIFRLEENSSA